MTIDVKTEVNGSLIQAKIKKAAQLTQPVLDSQVMKDSNKYCPQDTGILQKSVITHSVIGSGLLVWRTPYAKAQYYGLPNKSHQKNPFATMKWFEVAKSKCLRQWEQIINGKFGKNFKQLH